jgi:hypothetical protein
MLKPGEDALPPEIACDEIRLVAARWRESKPQP